MPQAKKRKGAAKSTPKWKRFEAFVAEIQRELTPDAEVVHDQLLLGRRTGVVRQVDVVVRTQVGQFPLLFIMDCKDRKSRVDVNEVGQFMELVDDVGATQGALVATAGFTSTARVRAESAHVRILRAVDVESLDWRSVVELPVVAELTQMERWKYGISGTGPFKMDRMPNNETILYDGSGVALDSFYNLLAMAWTNHSVPNMPGVHTDILLGDGNLLCDEKLYPIRLVADVMVRTDLYFGSWPLSKVKGFVDDTTKKLHTRSITTNWLSVEDIEANWKRIESRDEIAVKVELELKASVGYGKRPMQG